MSILLRRAANYLQNRDLQIDTECTYVFCTDSKGNYLQQHVPQQYINNFIWLTKRGRTTTEGINYLIAKIKELDQTHHKLTIVFWHGTCSVTTKKGKFIYLRNENNSEVMQMLKEQYEILYQIKQEYPTIKLVILEAPPISAKKWNELHGGLGQDKGYDTKINYQVEVHNDIIREYNKSLNSESPKFSLDLIKSRKSNPNKPTEYDFNFYATTDGIHPKNIIAKKWLYSIMGKII